MGRWGHLFPPSFPILALLRPWLRPVPPTPQPPPPPRASLPCNNIHINTHNTHNTHNLNNLNNTNNNTNNTNNIRLYHYHLHQHFNINNTNTNHNNDKPPSPLALPTNDWPRGRKSPEVRVMYCCITDTSALVALEYGILF